MNKLAEAFWAGFIKQAKNSRDKCMRCDKEPTQEIRWAGHRARAWFCDEHAEDFKEEKGDDISYVRDVPHGVVPEDHGDGPVSKEEAEQQKEAQSRNYSFPGQPGDILSSAIEGANVLSGGKYRGMDINDLGEYIRAKIRE